ncbi:lymphocyte function-associated antigen 3 isoform X3 [Gavia stellata]|uniref:lymphocyte function-associated antigen 3 isoform X3 n=1 Tax=Gavia stellata TaxID=37040 RepID=UPI00289712A4|nr:lymphocyte function-associated antigen 3 isoform X3 [Gavia stellata]
MFRHGWRQLPGGAAEGLLASLGWLLFFVSLMAHIHCEDVFGIVGENFTFPVKIDQKIAEIIWTKDKDKVAEWEEQNNLIYFTSLRNRGLLNKENGCLTIFNLENNDAGTYVLDYFDSLKINYILTFVLSVLAPPSEPEISCNISGDDLVLKCTADFQQPLNYTWKFSSIQIARQTQEVFIPKENVDASEKAACFIKFSQTEKSSEISLTQCFPDKQDKELNKEDSALKDKQTVNNGVNQEEATEDAEGGNGERLSNSPSCSKEDLKS